MKGLLLKDLYMIKKYCKVYLLVTVIFIALPLTSNNMYFVFYPCFICGMIPVNLLSYDEKSRWMQYSKTLPYTDCQIVSAKYLIGLMVQTAVLLITAISQALKMNINGTFQLKDFVVIMLMTLIVSTLFSSITLPFMFRFGVEKGRIIYLIMIAVVCAGGFIVSDIFINSDIQNKTGLNYILPLLCLVNIILYALSWYLSSVLFRKREL